MKYPYLLFTILILFAYATPSHAQAQWEETTNTGISFQNAYRFDDIWFLNRDTGFVVSGNGYLYYTNNAAQGWSIKLATAGSAYFRSLEFSDDGNTGIAGSLSGTVYRTANRGGSWFSISQAIPDTGVYNLRICGLAHYGDNFYGVGWWGGSTARFYKSTDLGQNWHTSYIDHSLATGLVDITFLSAQKGFATGGRQYGNKQACVVLKTNDGGDTWSTAFSDTTISGRIWKIQFIDQDTGYASIEPLYYPDTVAIIKTTDGGNSWHIIPIGSMASDYYGTQGIGFINAQRGWVGGYYDGMFETNDYGQTWQHIPQGNGCNRYFRVDAQTMYVSGSSIYRYTDSSLEVKSNKTAHIRQLSMDPIYPNPSGGKVHISFELKQQNNVRLEVVDLDGKHNYTVMSGYLKPGHYEYTWDGSNMPDGHYMAWLGTDEIPVVQKFLLKK